jgi:hypothetical protein
MKTEPFTDVIKNLTSDFKRGCFDSIGQKVSMVYPQNIGNQPSMFSIYRCSTAINSSSRNIVTLWNKKLHYRARRSPQLDSMNPIHTLTIHFSKIQFNLILLFRVLQSEIIMWDFKFSRRRVWSSKLSGIITPDDGGSTHLWNVGRNYFTRQYIPRKQFWTSRNNHI